MWEVKRVGISKVMVVPPSSSTALNLNWFPQVSGLSVPARTQPLGPRWSSEIPHRRSTITVQWTAEAWSRAAWGQHCFSEDWVSTRQREFVWREVWKRPPQESHVVAAEAAAPQKKHVLGNKKETWGLGKSLRSLQIAGGPFSTGENVRA